MKRKSIGGGVYEELNAKGRATKRYWLRPAVKALRPNGEPGTCLTWKLIEKATTREEARKAALDFKPDANSFAASADLYVRRGCPTQEHQWKTGSATFVENETRNAKRLKGFFGKHKISELHNGLLPDYLEWRTHGLEPEEYPTRQIDTETQTLSNIKGYILFITKSPEINNLKYARPRFHKTRSPSRKRAPASADIIHAVSEAFFNGGVRGEVFGFLNYFAMFTGCRKSELLKLRLDAGQGEAGYITRSAPFDVPRHKAILKGHGYIDLGRRLKQRDPDNDGVNPECILWPEFEEMLDCFLYWHEQRYPESPWYFPGLSGVQPLDRMSFNHALNRVIKQLELPHITPHGSRSYFTTKLIRDGFRYEEVAEMIGDKTVGVLRGGYSKRSSGDLLKWVPTTGLPGWLRWQSPEKKIVALKK